MIIKKLKNKLDNWRFKHGTPEFRAEFMRTKVAYMGKNVKLFTWTLGTEPYLIKIHDNVNVASEVMFINHDVSVFNMSRYLGLDYTLDKVGTIELWDNCMIGARTILMPGCSVGKNSVVAAGSVVTKRIPDDEVWGGNPAHFIMKVDEYALSLVKKNNEYPWIKNNKFVVPQGSKQLFNLRQKYLFKS